MRRIFLVLGVSLLLSGCANADTIDDNSSSSSSSSVQASSAAASVASSVAPVPASSTPVQTGDFDPLANIDVTAIPAKFTINVPFMAQAPTADWTDALNEACEEASLYNVEKYLSKQAMPSAAQAEKDLYAMIEWQTQNGYEWDINADQVAEVARKYLKRSAIVYADKDVTEQNIKALIANGHPVIIPAAGQMLGNPYFSGDGPPYHMLVIVGYDAQGFITNDVGTRRGDKYRYSVTTIMNSIHDWTGEKETITRGRKAIVVVGE